MAQKYDNLPVFKAIYAMLLTTLEVSHKATKDYRYSLCEDLKKRLFEMQILVYRANKEANKEKKVQYVNEMLELLVVVKLCYRILHDSKQLSLNRFAQIAYDLVEIEKHLEKWKQYNEKQSNQ